MAKRHSPPHIFPPAQKAEWNRKYDEALKTAKVNFPDDEKVQYAAANKAANAMLAVPAPDSSEAIDKLPDWQVVGTRGTKVVEGVEHRTVVTIDGRLHVHPVKAKK